MKKRLRKKLADRYDIICGEEIYSILFRKDWEERAKIFFSKADGEKLLKSLDKYSGRKRSSKYIFLSIRVYKDKSKKSNKDLIDWSGRLNKPLSKRRNENAHFRLR